MRSTTSRSQGKTGLFASLGGGTTGSATGALGGFNETGAFQGSSIEKIKAKVGNLNAEKNDEKGAKTTFTNTLS